LQHKPQLPVGCSLASLVRTRIVSVGEALPDPTPFLAGKQ
jgi:hypothetical protein